MNLPTRDFMVESCSTPWVTCSIASDWLWEFFEMSSIEVTISSMLFTTVWRDSAVWFAISEPFPTASIVLLMSAAVFWEASADLEARFGYYCKALSGFACACGFNGCIERQYVGLECDIFDGLDYLTYLVGVMVDILHCSKHIIHALVAQVGFSADGVHVGVG